MNVRTQRDPKIRAALYSRAVIRSFSGGFQRQPKKLVPLDKGTLLAWSVLWYSDAS